MDLSQNKFYLQVQDHSVSKEEFSLYLNPASDFLFTNPKPEGEALAAYYESEDYISHTDAKRSWFEKAYHFVKKIALKNKIELINKLTTRKGVLLDIGAGTGEFLSVAKENGWHIIGAEPNAKARAIALQKGISLNNDTSLIKENSVDVITMWHVLEHVPDLEAQIKELKRLLKPNGTILIAVPNYKSYDAQYYGSYWAAYDVPRHLWHFSKQSIAYVFERENFHLVKTFPMYFDAFYVALLSEKYKSGHMNLIKAAMIGLKSNWKARTSGEYSSHIYIIKNQ